MSWIAKVPTRIRAGSAAARRRIFALREATWPVLEPLTPKEERQRSKKLNADMAMIAAWCFSNAGDAALEEARRMADAETDRRKGADQKAAIYLAVVAALTPLILTLAMSTWEEAGSAPTVINMGILGLAVAYISWAGLWAFRVLEVTPSNHIGVNDLDAASKDPQPTDALIRMIVRCARQNHRGTNEKISSIKMAHAFLLRAFFAFTLLLFFNIFWYFGEILLE